MKKLKYIGILFLLILFSCVDDESRYGDIDIDEIKIEGIKDYQEIEVGGKLTIAPVVTQSSAKNRIFPMCGINTMKNSRSPIPCLLKKIWMW